jgi:hypothetical protein
MDRRIHPTTAALLVVEIPTATSKAIALHNVLKEVQWSTYTLIIETESNAKTENDWIGLYLLAL